jgi:predicted secreted Zn-dependent protease
MKAGLNIVWVLAIVAGAAWADPATRFGASYYYIDGASALILTAQMDSNGPTSDDGRHHPALTKWDVQWRFRHNMYGDVCKMEKVGVMVGVTTIRPRWRGEKQGAEALRERWKIMVEAINRNEAFHKQQAVEAGKKIETALNEIEPTETCEALTEAANEVASGILAEHKKASREHNETTDFGRKNGVSLI